MNGILDLDHPSQPSKVDLDGFFSNRLELEVYSDRSEKRSSLTDSELLWELFRRFGNECVEKLQGEFAFVIWDKDQKKLLSARDQMGIKPLFYSWDGKIFKYSSRLKHLIESNVEPLELDKEYLGYILLDLFIHQDRTIYKNIKRLAPAHVISYSDSFQIQRYWHLQPESRKSHERTEDYEEEFRATLNTAVKCRLRTPEPTGIFLSGGIDSTALAWLALRAGQPHLIHTFSLKYADPKCDDSEALENFTSKADWPAHFVQVEDEFSEAYYDDVLADLEYHPTFYFYRMLLKIAQTKNVKRIFTGVGGDDIFSAPIVGPRDWLKMLSPQLVVNLKRKLTPTRAPNWMPRSTAKMFNFSKKASEYFDQEILFRNPAQQGLYSRLFLWGGYSQSFEQEQQLAQTYGVEMSYPYFDLKMINLAFKLPIDLISGKPPGKPILRRAFKKAIPFHSQRSAHQDATSIIRLVEDSQNLFKNHGKSFYLEDIGLIKAGYINKLINTDDYMRKYDYLYRVISIEKQIEEFTRNK